MYGPLASDEKSSLEQVWAMRLEQAARQLEEARQYGDRHREGLEREKAAREGLEATSEKLT